MADCVELLEVVKISVDSELSEVVCSSVELELLVLEERLVVSPSVELDSELVVDGVSEELEL